MTDLLDPCDAKRLEKVAYCCPVELFQVSFVIVVVDFIAPTDEYSVNCTSGNADPSLSGHVPPYLRTPRVSKPLPTGSRMVSRTGLILARPLFFLGSPWAGAESERH